METIGLFPTWYEPILGSGWVLGVIATVHLLASHTSVGAALVSAWLATVAVKRNRPELLEYVRRYGVFLLVFSYVLGSITGPGIWFSATVASPRGLSALIHGYVWYWATEWVFFVIEVIGIYLMVYLAGRVDSKSYLTIAWIFGAASWCKMLVDYRDGRVGGQEAPIMAALAQGLVPEEMSDLSEWLASLQRPLKRGRGNAPTVLQGDRKRLLPPCEACHGANGQGWDIQPAISGQNRGYFEAVLHRFKSGERHNDLNGGMQMIAKRLSEDEIRQLADYFGR